MVGEVGAAHAKPAPPPAAVAVIDLRADVDDSARAELLAALRAVELVPVGGEAAVALVGRDLDQQAAITALVEAQAGFGELDCGRARPSAELAAQLLTARRAAGLDDLSRLARAWAYVALCAERDGDRSSARFAVERLRALGFKETLVGPLPADAWARHPEIDASTDRDIIELTVTGPAGAIAWVDDRPIGLTPAKTFVSAGKHVVAVADGPQRGAVLVTALGQPLTIDVETAREVGAVEIANRVRSWQRAGAVDTVALDDVMTRAHAELAVVIGRDGRATLWQRVDGKLTPGASGDGAAIANATHDAWSATHDRAPAAGEPLLREQDDADRVERKRGEKAPARWWVYAAIGGAVAVGALVIYAVDAGEDRQHFELRF